MKIYHNRCGDNHIKIVEGDEKVGKEYSFLIDTETMETANGKCFGIFDGVSEKITRMIEKGLILKVYDERACYVSRFLHGYYLNGPSIANNYITLRDLLLQKEIRDFAFKNKMNNQNFLKDEKDLNQMILEIYNNKTNLEFIVDRYILF